MSVEQYQRTVNGLDKEIADLEKKKAVNRDDSSTTRTLRIIMSMAENE